MMRYWNKLVSMEDNIIAKRVFETILLQNSTKWLKTLTEILTNIGLYDCIQSRSKCDIRECREALLNKHKADWQRMVPTKPKLRTYAQIKPCFAPEKYAVINLERNQRSVLAQLRCSILPLRIETGRFTGLKPEDRKCEMCKNNVPEDECPFLFNCETDAKML